MIVRFEVFWFPNKRHEHAFGQPKLDTLADTTWVVCFPVFTIMDSHLRRFSIPKYPLIGKSNGIIGKIPNGFGNCVGNVMELKI